MPIPNSPMSPEDGRRLARQRVWVRKQRTRGIRRRVAAITLSLFVALWVAIFVHLVTGHDPALGSSSRPAKVSTTATQTAPAKAKTSAPAAAAASSAQAATSDAGASGSSTGTSSSGSGSSGSSSSGSSGSSSSAAPVTTSQS
jgi:uncharacterized membrane protein YgcG